MKCVVCTDPADTRVGDSWDDFGGVPVCEWCREHHSLDDVARELVSLGYWLRGDTLYEWSWYAPLPLWQWIRRGLDGLHAGTIWPYLHEASALDKRLHFNGRSETAAWHWQHTDSSMLDILTGLYSHHMPPVRRWSGE